MLFPTTRTEPGTERRRFGRTGRLGSIDDGAHDDDSRLRWVWLIHCWLPLIDPGQAPGYGGLVERVEDVEHALGLVKRRRPLANAGRRCLEKARHKVESVSSPVGRRRDRGKAIDG